MKPYDLIAYYGDAIRAAKYLGVTPGAIYQWMQSGTIPALRQSDIEVRTGYQLKSDFTMKRLIGRNVTDK
ncbi:Cro/CI family transcriptional regulator [Xenorhabdus bovienii]|uniref:Cro/CI family transcriptional regulator n=1 Tax=Xenorhabdus bovienii TaxID=40576 RepID=UPI0004D6B261|nr:Cro/CI family transcriptional regulator [Xenorhabdus bovienii]CDG88117.1 Gp39 [Xenorhabdus bovienii str. feltiae France]CDG91810.1 Gp39 [Xenorhabdus bovienii str. feltiae Florida]